MSEQTVADEAQQSVQAIGPETETETRADSASEAEQATAAAAEKKPPRRRAPRRDEVLAVAVEAARAGLAGVAEEDQVGEHRGASVDDDRLMTHRWDATLPGYRGWQWYSTVARAPRSKHVTVCEVGLAAGEDSIVAPPWVPYADRVSEEERERMKAVAEGRDPHRPAEAGDQAEEAAVVVTEEAADAPAEQAADPDPGPETDSAPDAEAPEAEEAAEEPAQES